MNYFIHDERDLSPAYVRSCEKFFDSICWPSYYGGTNTNGKIYKLNENTTPKPCVLVSPPWLVKPFLNQESYSCFGSFNDIDTGFARPFLAVQHVRNLKRGKFYKCNPVYKSKFNLLFSNEDFITGRLLQCN